MAEYIERERLLAEYDRQHTGEPGRARKLIEDAPAADVAPVVHGGRWESVKNPNWPAYSHDKCNLCGWWNTRNALCYDGNHKPGHSLNYCPNCGADMRGSFQNGNNHAKDWPSYMDLPREQTDGE